MKWVIVIFLLVVGIFAAIVTFPWGLAILFMASIAIFGLDATAAGTKGVLGIVLSAGLLLVTVLAFVAFLAGAFA